MSEEKKSLKIKHLNDFFSKTLEDSNLLIWFQGLIFLAGNENERRIIHVKDFIIFFFFDDHILEI